MSQSSSAYVRQIRGHRALALIKELALGNKSQKELAKEYGYSESAISQFRQRKAAEIQAVIDKTEDEYASLWIADQRNRIAELQDLDEFISELIYSADKLDTAVVNAILRKTQILRNVAEERGHLSQKVETTGSVSVELIGIDLEGI